jgi:hypothetical protein
MLPPLAVLPSCAVLPPETAIPPEAALPPTTVVPPELMVPLEVVVPPSAVIPPCAVAPLPLAVLPLVVVTPTPVVPPMLAVVPPGLFEPPVAVAPARLVAPAPPTDVWPPLPLVLPPVGATLLEPPRPPPDAPAVGATLLEPPPLPPDAPGELEEEQPAQRAMSRTKPSPRGSISLCNQVRGCRAVTYRSMVTPLKPLGSRCAFALSNTSSSETGHLWPIPRGVQKCTAPTSENRQLGPAWITAGLAMRREFGPFRGQFS